MRLSIITVLLLSFLFVNVGYCYESKPLVMGPCNLVEQLPEPAKSLHTTIADSLHSEQVRLIEKEDSSFNTVLSIIALALEEYYHRELSYPKTSEDLVSSGYLDPDWLVLDYQICDYDTTDAKAVISKVIIYVPQPIGLTELSPVPGKNCAFTRFCYNEYILMLESNNSSLERKISYPDWFSPYALLGFNPVFYVSQSNPGASECAGC